MAPISEEMGFGKDGAMLLHGRSWPEPYSPSIDQMMLNLAQQFGDRCGVIAFSGMGSDGAIGATDIRAAGGTVWVQSADSCVQSSMPDSVRQIGAAEAEGTPVELAEKLLIWLAERVTQVA